MRGKEGKDIDSVLKLLILVQIPLYILTEMLGY